MKISYKDLQKFFDNTPAISEVSKKLFQLGHEHEVKNNIFDFEFTPNRGDCLSLLGIARDLNVFFDIKKEVDIFKGEIKEFGLDFLNHSPEVCPKISFLKIKVANRTSEYKNYLSDYFANTESKRNNFFTDISNFVSYELGQPTHCFDNAKINGTLVFENKDCDEDFELLIGEKIKLSGENSIFKIGDEVVSLAGVMGGSSTACSDNTNYALVECAYFVPEAILGKSLKYNIVSDAAYKFERGTDPNAIDRTLRRFIEIVADHASIESFEIFTYDSEEFKQKKIKEDFNKINEILGTSITRDKYISILEKLGFSIDDGICVPSFRHDIRTQNDLAEEVARVIGYNNITSSPLKLKKSQKKINSDKLKIIKTYLASIGFNEVINLPFIKSKNDSAIRIDNPLDSNREFLRTDLKESLIDNLLYNERRQKDSIKFFEISDVYKNEEEIKRSSKVAIIVSGRRGHDHINFSKILDDKYLKEVLSSLIKNDLHIEEILRDSLDTKIKNKIFYIELDIEDIILESNLEVSANLYCDDFVKYEKISDYPSSTRDISLMIEDHTKIDQIVSYLKGIKEQNIKDCFIFDFYKNEERNEIKIGFRMIFQSKEKTLLDEDIKNSIEEIVYPLLKIDGVSIPGM